MRKYPKFREFAEAKDDGFGAKNGSIPNQDIPKPVKLPELLKLKQSLGGDSYKGQFATDMPKKQESPLPYKNNKDVAKGDVLVKDDGDPKDGLAFKGNKVQTPTNSAALGEKPDLKVQKVKTKGKMTSEQFIKETKGMSPEEFLGFFTEGSDEPLPTVADLYGNQFTPDPTQTIEYMASLMKKNPRLLSRFFREVKRSDGGHKLLMDEHMEHPEFYSGLAESMAAPEGGRKKCHRIARAMNEQHMNALNKFKFENFNEEVEEKNDLAFEDGGPLGDQPDNPSGLSPKPKLAQPKGGAMGGGGVGGANPAPAGGAMGGGGPAGPMPAAPGGPMGGGGPGSGASPDAGMPGAGPEAMPPGTPTGPGGGPPPMPPTGGTNSGSPMGFDAGSGGQPNGGSPTPKYMGESAHGNMIEEMGTYPHFLTHMSDFCLNGNCKNKGS